MIAILFDYKWIFAIGLAFIMTTPAAPETWRKDTFGPPTLRSDKGDVWKKSEFEYETWRSNRGEVCRRDHFSDTVRCTK